MCKEKYKDLLRKSLNSNFYDLMSKEKTELCNIIIDLEKIVRETKAELQFISSYKN